jgi:hypothetical protein
MHASYPKRLTKCEIGGVVRVVTIGVTHYYTCLRIFSFCVRREKLSLLVPPSLPTGTWAGAPRAPAAGDTSAPARRRTPPKLDYTCTPSDSPLRDLRPLALRSTVRSVRATGRYRDRTVPLAAIPHKFIPLLLAQHEVEERIW